MVTIGTRTEGIEVLIVVVIIMEMTREGTKVGNNIGRVVLAITGAAFEAMEIEMEEAMDRHSKMITAVVTQVCEGIRVLATETLRMKEMNPWMAIRSEEVETTSQGA